MENVDIAEMSAALQRKVNATKSDTGPGYATITGQ